jgi:two-component system response regulator MprA
MADVLVVDDDPDIRGLLAFTLEDEGHDVRVAGDGEAALEALTVQPPDCMVLDLMMPGLDGFAVLRARRQQGLASDMRVLILTCRTAERDYVRGWELGADEYVTKPFDPEAVLARVSELLAISPAALTDRRNAELQKAELLDRLESAFSRPL